MSEGGPKANNSMDDNGLRFGVSKFLLHETLSCGCSKMKYYDTVRKEEYAIIQEKGSACANPEHRKDAEISISA